MEQGFDCPQPLGAGLRFVLAHPFHDEAVEKDGAPDDSSLSQFGDSRHIFASPIEKTIWDEASDGL